MGIYEDIAKKLTARGRKNDIPKLRKMISDGYKKEAEIIKIKEKIKKEKLAIRKLKENTYSIKSQYDVRYKNLNGKINVKKAELDDAQREINSLHKKDNPKFYAREETLKMFRSKCNVVIADLNTKIKKLDVDYSNKKYNLEEKIEEKEFSIADMESKMSSNRNYISNLKKELTRLKNSL